MRLLSFLFALGFAAIAFAAEPPPQRIDINNASQEAIETLPGIGPAIAQEIIKGRPYRTFADLDKVKGIGPKKLDQLRGRVVIAPARGQLPAMQVRSATNQIAAKVNLNSATQAELEKLPGIGPKRAEAIIAARPFKQIEDLKKVKGLTRAQLNELKTQVVVR
jgi:competence protein ComEA